MMTTIQKATAHRRGIAVAVLAAILAVSCVLAVTELSQDDSDAATSYTSGTIYLQPGQSYTWTPELNIPDERTALTVAVSRTASTPGAYSTSKTLDSLTASISDHTLSLSVGDSAAARTLYVFIKAEVTTGVYQTVTYTATVNIIKPTITYNNGEPVTLNQGQPGVSLQPTISGTGSLAVTYSSTERPSNLQFNSSTGLISGSVSDTVSAGTKTVKVTGTISGISPVQTFSTDITFVVSGSISLDNLEDVYVIKDGSSYKRFTLTGSGFSSNVKWSITSDEVPGITISRLLRTNGYAGQIAVAPTTAAGDYDITYMVQDSKTGASAEGAVRIVVCELDITGVTAGTGGTVSGSTLYAKTGSAATFNADVTSGPSSISVKYTLTDSSGKTISGVTVNSATGRITVSSSVAAGTYSLKLTGTQSDSGATDTLDLTLIVDAKAAFVNSITNGSLSIKGN